MKSLIKLNFFCLVPALVLSCSKPAPKNLRTKPGKGSALSDDCEKNLSLTEIPLMQLPKIKESVSLGSGYVAKVYSDDSAKLFWGDHEICNGGMRYLAEENRFLGLPVNLPLIESLPAEKSEKSIVAMVDKFGFEFLEIDRTCVALDALDEMAYWINADRNGQKWRLLAKENRIVDQYQPDSFHAVGSGTIYADHLLRKDTKPVELVDLADGSELQGAVFKVVVPDEFKKAESQDRKFIYKAGDERIAQVSAYYNAENYRSWVKKNGVFGCNPISVHLYDAKENNAEYTISVEGDQITASVLIGQGTDGILQNLEYDPEVLWHELGHHVIFRTLKVSGHESKVLHEGLADALVFLKTDDACLADSVCPTNSKACFVKNQCLRSGELDLRIGDQQYESLKFHQQSQLISGLVWDVANTIGRDKTTKLLFKSFEYLTFGSDFKFFIESMAHADKIQNQSKNTCVIYEKAIERGLKSQVDQVKTAYPCG